jgi:3-oxoacyl-[acyl-carrier protein] reductase
MPNKVLSHKLAIVTGATRSHGIGAAICRKLAEAGANIYFTTWQPYDETMPWKGKPDEPERLVEELRGHGIKADYMELDLSQPMAYRRLFDCVPKTLGQPDILVNNAAYSTRTPYETMTEEDLDRHYEVNVRGTLMLSVEFARRFQKGSGGRIIQLTSGQALGPMAGELAYIASKGAIAATTSTLAAEVASKGITVNAVNPGPTNTGWMSPELEAELLPKFPLGRVGQPDDVARLILFLASEEARWITGQVLHSEGGFIRE